MSGIPAWSRGKFGADMSSFRDRFFTPLRRKAILSWRILLGAGIGVAVAMAGLPILVAGALGGAVYAGAVVAAMPDRDVRVSIDPFTLGEPWRQFVQAAQRSRRQLTATVARVAAGPLRDRLQAIAGKLDGALAESWDIARRGNEIDGLVTRARPDTVAVATRNAPTASGGGADRERDGGHRLRGAPARHR